MLKNSEAVKAWRQTTKARMVSAMGGKCQCCGYDTCNNSLAFHHLDPAVKELGFGVTRSNPKNWNTVVNELRKCILVCHNCHSEIHAGVRQVPEIFTTFDNSFIEYKIAFSKEYDKCPICNGQKQITSRFCSPKCASTNRRKVDWDKVDLLALMKINTISELEDMFGISNAAIYKRRNKLLKQIIP